jgi:hypothetical protein
MLHHVLLLRSLLLTAASAFTPASSACCLQMLGLSLLFFRSPKSPAARLMRAASGAITASITISGSGSSHPKQSWLGANLPIILMYSPVHVFFSLWVLSYVFLPLHVAIAGWVAFLVPYYGFTQGGRPAHTGTEPRVAAQWRMFPRTCV